VRCRRLKLICRKLHVSGPENAAFDFDDGRRQKSKVSGRVNHFAQGVEFHPRQAYYQCDRRPLFSTDWPSPPRSVKDHERAFHVVSGSLAGKTFGISHGKLIVGREEDCHLRLDDPRVSRHHCALLLDEYTLRIRDLGSKSGTWVNAKRIGTTEAILLNDDTVLVAGITFRIDLSQAPPEQAAEDEKPATASPAMEGTGVFDLDATQADTKQVLPPATTQLPAADRPAL
jgi:pSer/pThr/pTyr-binding forkhead associated (FHA) protein